MFQRMYGFGPVVAENDKFQVKIYLYPNEGGGWHVHVVRKSDRADVKIGLWEFELKRPTQFDRESVKKFQIWVYENRHYLRKKWAQKVLNPMRLIQKGK